jgi:hypothetical protein
MGARANNSRDFRSAKTGRTRRPQQRPDHRNNLIRVLHRSYSNPLGRRQSFRSTSSNGELPVHRCSSSTAAYRAAWAAGRTALPTKRSWPSEQQPVEAAPFCLPSRLPDSATALLGCGTRKRPMPRASSAFRRRRYQQGDEAIDVGRCFAGTKRTDGAVDRSRRVSRPVRPSPGAHEGGG